MDYVVYAYKNAEGQLETGTCTRTRPLAKAAEDIQYFHAMADAPALGEIRVVSGFAGVQGRAGVRIIADREGVRYPAVTDGAGNVRFTGLPPGEYTIHEESDGDLPDDPTVQLYAKGCRSLTLFRALRIIGRVKTKSGQPAGRVEVGFRSTELAAAGDGRLTDADGNYEVRIIRPGRYYLGINLEHTATRYTPYPRWFYPGTEDPALATIIDFSGKPGVQIYDFTLPDRQAERIIEGVVLRADGSPRPQGRLSVIDASETLIADGIADPNGRFVLHVFANTPYRLDAVWPGRPPDGPFSAVPVDIPAGSDPLSLKLVLTEPGNSVLDRQNGAGNRR
jgi:hypothetical protein